MPLNILRQLNWLDIFVVIVLIRVCLVALKNGFPVELFKLLGVVVAVYASLHYYSRLGAYASAVAGLKNISPGLLGFISLITIALAALFASSFLRRIFFQLVKVEAVSNLNKWGGFFVGVVRGFLFLSLVLFIFIASGSAYLQRSVAVSFSGKKIFKLAPRAYSVIFKGVVSKFCAVETYNQSVIEAQKLTVR